ncbi:MAG: hypothetical protein ACRDKW_09865 [Actinomycetota bacterium]
MKLPIDTSAIVFSVALPPEPARDWDTKEQRIDADGQPVYAIQLVALGEGSAQILPVKFAGKPEGLTQGMPLKVTGLFATPWSMNDRFGVSFRAQSIVPAIPAQAANGAEAKAGRS